MKSTLREKMKIQRNALSEEERQYLGQQAMYQIMPLLSVYNHILLFSSFGSEIPTFPLISELSQSKTVYLPRVHHKELEICPYDPNQLSVSNYGILEPTTPAVSIPMDFILVPGLAFSKSGHRLGYGGGFYDRLLPLHPKALKIGYGFSFQLLDYVPSNHHDAKIDGIVTEVDLQIFHG